MPKRFLPWAVFGFFLLGLWLLIMIWATSGGPAEKKEPSFDDFHKGVFPKFDEP